MLSLRRVLALAALLGLAQAAHAQLATGSIVGSVLDPQGAGIPAAQVHAVNGQTGASFATQSSEAGLYFFPALPVGIYDLTAELSGFKKLNLNGVEVRVAEGSSTPLPAVGPSPPPSVTCRAT